MVKKGFTLIEILTVSGIMALLSLTLISIFLSSFRGGTKADITQKLHQEGDFVIKNMSREIRRTALAVCGTDLNLDLNDGTSVRYWLDDERIASDSAYLTGTANIASGLTFSCLTGTLGNQIVTISFDLTLEQQTQNFATSVATRQY